MLSKNRKKMKIRTTPADQSETEFTSNNRSKRAGNMFGRHHAPNYHRFPDIRLRFTLVRLIFKKYPLKN